MAVPRPLILGLGLLALAMSLAHAQAPAPAGPLTLQQCLEMALQRHPDVASARAALQQAQAQASLTRSGLYPQVGLELAGRVTQSLGRPVNVGGGVIQVQGDRSTQRDAEANLNWTVFQSGQRTAVRQSRTQALAAGESLEDVQRLLAYEVQSVYYQALAARQQAVVAMRAVANSQRHLDLVQARLEQGQVPASDLLPIKAEVARTRLESIQAETTLGVSEATLRSLLVLPPGLGLELADPLPAQPVTAELPRLLELAAQQRPDLSAQQLRLLAARLGTKSAREQAGVQLSATASGDYGRHTGTTGETWTVQVGASYPLFDAGASRAEVTVARAREEQARQNLANLQLQMQQEVEAAYLQMRQAAAAREAAAVAREESQKSLEAAEARYREGLAIVIEVTDAQVTLLRAELSELQARYDFALALAGLHRSVGISPLAPAGDVK